MVHVLVTGGVGEKHQGAGCLTQGENKQRAVRAAAQTRPLPLAPPASTGAPAARRPRRSQRGIPKCCPCAAAPRSGLRSQRTRAPPPPRSPKRQLPAFPPHTLPTSRLTSPPPPPPRLHRQPHRAGPAGRRPLGRHCRRSVSRSRKCTMPDSARALAWRCSGAAHPCLGMHAHGGARMHDSPLPISAHAPPAPAPLHEAQAPSMHPCSPTHAGPTAWPHGSEHMGKLAAATGARTRVSTCSHVH